LQLNKQLIKLHSLLKCHINKVLTVLLSSN